MHLKCYRSQEHESLPTTSKKANKMSGHTVAQLQRQNTPSEDLKGQSQLTASCATKYTDDNGVRCDIASDPSLIGLTLYEKKSVIINRELNAMGMGRYQWYIWSLCGLGYFLDLLWAQAFGLIATPLKQELGFSSA